MSEIIAFVFWVTMLDVLLATVLWCAWKLRSYWQVREACALWEDDS